jgi:acyl carrier protein
MNVLQQAELIQAVVTPTIGDAADGLDRMNNPYTAETMLALLIEHLAQVLGVDASSVEPDAALVNDLNADSLDFVEFRYNVERTVGIEMPHKSVLDHLVDITGSADHVYEKGRITELAADMLRRSFFQYSEEQIRAGMQPYDVMAVTTVRNWAHYCHALLNTLPAQCPDCGGTQSRRSASGRAQCADCGALLRPQSGDVAMAARLGTLVDQSSHRAELV